ncbi:hypothetical protein AMS68_005503 [Peltaster fructicola]|uniref:Kinesin motor domain-containing protein n=1 Tax=Peltaster fructicola TaxID=286661 RepID=A0A6H0XZ83_9PEZI|nr:hypothetical protein AMS68_005503 [Peltaster fructicola]
MERPSSRLENARPTGIKPPGSRLPTISSTTTTSRALLESSQSELNARAANQTAMMPPPATNGKHRMNGLPESAPKQRKTLAERAGEPYSHSRSQLAHPRPLGTTLPNAARANGHQTRGIKSAYTSQLQRPASAHSQPSAKQYARNYEVDDDDDDNEEEDTETIGKRKGITHISLSPRNVINTKARHSRPARAQAAVLPRSQHLGSFSDSYVQQCELRNSRLGEVARVDTKRSRTLDAALAGLTLTRSKSKEMARCEEPLLPAMPGSFISEGDVNHNDATRSQVSPSKLPKAIESQALPSRIIPCTPPPLKQKDSSFRLSARRNEAKPTFLTKESCTPIVMKASLTHTPAWDTRGRLEDLDKTLAEFQSQLNDSASSKTHLEEMLSMYKSSGMLCIKSFVACADIVKVEKLQRENEQLKTEHQTANNDLQRMRGDLQSIGSDLERARWDHERNQSEADRRHENELRDVQVRHDKQLERLEREGERAVEQLEKEVKEMKQSLEKQKTDELTNLQSEHWDEIDQLRVKHDAAMAALKKDLEQMKKSDEGRAAESASQVQTLRETIVSMQSQIQVSNVTTEALRAQIMASEGRNTALEQEKLNLISKAHFLEGNQEAQSQEFTNMTRRLQVAEAKAASTVEQLRREETVRRRLNAQILELKGNIRVFARIRPVLTTEEGPAKVEYPDIDDLDGGKEMIVHAPTSFTATGKERNEKFPFGFDRVYAPESSNHNVFEDCRDLVQSVVDGYNVSILSYGQTGSGKTYGMSGPDGIIPSSIALLLGEIERLKDKGWEYQVQASFVEVYNETLNDLLGDAKSWDNEDEVGSRTRSKAKHEIHHDSITGKTSVSNLTATTLWPAPDELRSDGVDYTKHTIDRLLDTATKNRRVAATRANERSSRSHSVFILTLQGSCGATGESSEGILNLVDLAGSERLKHSGAEGSRARETAAINTSLKSLGDVIEKIGSGGHVPYRNSKLTYLLQSSLGGTAANGKSSRTLMLLHLSPLQAHWQETKTSLQFGVKVHGTHIGTAKRK